MLETVDSIGLNNSFVLSHLKYCSPFLLGVGKVQVSCLEDANFYISRSVLGYSKTHISSIAWDCEHENAETLEDLQFSFVTL